MLKISTRTDATAGTLVVRRTGDEVPAPVARALLDRIAHHGDALLLYNYSGPVPALAPLGLSTVGSGTTGAVLIRTGEFAPAGR